MFINASGHRITSGTTLYAALCNNQGWQRAAVTDNLEHDMQSGFVIQ
jgi:hypothetical protein